MTAVDTKRMVNAAALCLLLLIVVGGILVLVRRPAGPSDKPHAINYTHNICDDAYKTEHDHSKENPPYIDIPLQEGCFSGFVTVPDKWQTWQVQMLRGQGWMAEWYYGWQQPMGPFSSDQMGAGLAAGRMPSRLARFEGSGTVRIYRITGDTHGGRPEREVDGMEAAVPPPEEKDPPPIEPDTPPAQGYSFVLEKCSHYAESLGCWGYMTNQTDAVRRGWLRNDDSVDDEGNKLAAVSAEFAGGSHSIRLVPGVKGRWVVKFSEPHMNAHGLTLVLAVHFDRSGEWVTTTDEVIFKNVKFQ